jgi:general secretion pathway protein G
MESASVPPDPSLDEGPERRRRGFTLIEIMAVVLIMGMLMGLVGVAVFNQVDKARVQTTKAKLKNLESALEFYRMDNSRYPSTEQGLVSLVKKPTTDPAPRNYPPGGYLQRGGPAAMEDAWDNEFHYESPGQNNVHSFDMWSLGADGEPGGQDADADIQNWSTQDLGG